MLVLIFCGFIINADPVEDLIKTSGGMLINTREVMY